MPKIYFDLGSATGLANPFAYNTIDDIDVNSGEIIADLRDDAGANTGLSFHVDSLFGNMGLAGHAADVGVGEYSRQVLQGNAITTNGGNSDVRISGLAANEAFSLSLNGHTATAGRHTQFTVNGVSADYLASGDAAAPNDGIVFEGTADASGNININVTKAASGQFYGYLVGGILSYGDSIAEPIPTLTINNGDPIQVWQGQTVQDIPFTVTNAEGKTVTALNNIGGVNATDVQHSEGASSGTFDLDSSATEGAGSGTATYTDNS